MAASDAQVQQYVNDYIRPFAADYRALKLRAENIRATIDDVYNALNVGSPTWTDTRDDAPPHLMTPADVLAMNTVAENLKAFMEAESQLPVVLLACVNQVEG